MYIFISLALLLILLIFLFAKKFTPNSFMMTNFKGNSFKTFSIGILIAATLSLSYGIYHAATYQPSYLDIKLHNQNYTVFGNVGEFGYFSANLPKKDVEVELYFASWETLQFKNPEIFIDYPSGKQEFWRASIVSISTNKLKEKHNIKEIYQLSPYSFKESGNITLTIKENNGRTKKVSIQVK
ncbi:MULTISPECIES: hypothetical protein [Bacillus]|uniref:Group-specific protein n=3 Tax=Bacillus toyonensis TaxID=155322 RepID=A0A2B5SVS6_9BACI|nr:MULTISPECIES: hypothetical protein [Bacillus]OTX25706.1 hypothetical protein BK717_30875 [Bacillus thuringiensis serovar malayensis]OUB02202.1 hypothetical protein BK709_26205 [Bacillus thuringiensis serovar shandongiensis]PKR92687.1 hypothetical protein bcere0024_03090 [Bacillus cereus Rock4-18]AXK18356.1 hypothetical protein DPQ31_11870 [Bacillus sp. COPE52]EJQ89678.1 hypothetical protein IGO_02174 [Bacillus toyonensis]